MRNKKKIYFLLGIAVMLASALILIKKDKVPVQDTVNGETIPLEKEMDDGKELAVEYPETKSIKTQEELSKFIESKGLFVRKLEVNKNGTFDLTIAGAKDEEPVVKMELAVSPELWKEANLEIRNLVNRGDVELTDTDKEVASAWRKRMLEDVK